MSPGNDEKRELEQLYRRLIDSWNADDVAAFSALFDRDGHSIGFDGSEMHGPDEIASALDEIFKDHETGRYVTKIRDVRLLTEDVGLLRAVVGMVPPGQDSLNPDVNAIQMMLAVRAGGDWRIAHFQNTPAQYHGRPEAAEALTAELTELI
jgi:uncharacterized protein (TIGR02246 family)